MRVIWTEPALDEIARVYEYLLDFNPRAAKRVAEGLHDAGESLNHLPHRGRPVPGTIMRDVITSFPYVIRYAVVGNDVLILRIRHTSRRPTIP